MQERFVEAGHGQEIRDDRARSQIVHLLVCDGDLSVNHLIFHHKIKL